MSTFQPPPTWANPVVVDEATGKSIFNPIWLKWFIDLGAGLTSAGAGSGNASGYVPVTTGNFAKWLDTSATALGDGGVIGSASHADATDFLPVGGTAVNSDALEGLAAADFLLVGGTAVNASALEGLAAAAFLLVGGTAVNSSALEGLAAAAFLLVGGTAVNSDALETKTWTSPGSLGTVAPATVHGTTVRATNAGGFEASTGNPGFTGTVTTASLVGKTITIEDGIITGFA